MNATGFSDDYNATFLGNESLDVNHTGSNDYDDESVITRSTIDLLTRVIGCVAAALGIPGNILSAIVWLRLHVTSKNSSAIYLAVLAINDLLWLSSVCLYKLIEKLHPSQRDVLRSAGDYWSVSYVARSAGIFEPLLVLSFSVERLIAIVRPLQVCRLCYKVSCCLLHTCCDQVKKTCQFKTWCKCDKSIIHRGSLMRGHFGRMHCRPVKQLSVVML